ncbi:MAG: iron uptake porin [Leptolyngbyaceae cyanobacterium bins.349]|nr:iron uptake porin [Leptolyngbyaceae cyanobacterium bins.349]
MPRFFPKLPLAIFHLAGVSIVGTCILGLQPAQAQEFQVLQADPLTPSSQLMETVNGVAAIADTTETTAMEQVTSVSQLTDVKPTDWAFQALQSLVERYGCIVGYPDKTYRGNRAITRYEFAAGLNACLDKIQELIAAATADFVKKEDLESVKRLQEEFAAELAALRGRIETLDVRTATLEKQQFSTTTKLFGQVVFGVQGRTQNQSDLFPRDGVQDADDPGTEINAITNVQLSLLTQFNPRSLLLTGLQAGAGSTRPFLSNNVRLGYEGDTGGSLVVSDLTYRQLIGDRFALVVGAEGVNAVNVFRGANRIESAGFGPLSAFAQRNPIINLGAGRAGVGFDWQLGSRISLQGVYSAGGSPNSPEAKQGLFNGRNTVGAQLTIAPTRSLDIALNYLHAYSPGSFLGFLGTGIGDDQVTFGPTRTHAVGGTISWRISRNFTLGGWAGYTSTAIPGFSGIVETINWMAFLNFPDLFGRGNLGAIYVGQPPKIFSSDLPTGANLPDILNGGIGAPGGQPSTTTHVEAFYRLRISDNIAVTPGVILIFNSRNTADNDPIAIGAIRTTFTF